MRKLTVISGALLAAFLLGGCDLESYAAQEDPQVLQGKRLIAEVGCGSCHMIPGIAGADGLVGPPLNHMANRQFIAGMLRNSPENMQRWLLDPQAIVPGNAMPDLNLTERQAQAITAYLATLE
jgi:cytochrome c2